MRNILFPDWTPEAILALARQPFPENMRDRIPAARREKLKAKKSQIRDLSKAAECGICAEWLGRVHELPRHVVSRHFTETQQEPYRTACPSEGCGRITLLNNNVKNHVERKHAGQPLTCRFRMHDGQECGSIHPDWDQLAQHRRSAHTRNLPKNGSWQRALTAAANTRGVLEPIDDLEGLWTFPTTTEDFAAPYIDAPLNVAPVAGPSFSSLGDGPARFHLQPPPSAPYALPPPLPQQAHVEPAPASFSGYRSFVQISQPPPCAGPIPTMAPPSYNTVNMARSGMGMPYTDYPTASSSLAPASFAPPTNPIGQSYVTPPANYGYVSNVGATPMSASTGPGDGVDYDTCFAPIPSAKEPWEVEEFGALLTRSWMLPPSPESSSGVDNSPATSVPSPNDGGSWSSPYQFGSTY
ncbi:hypothetical protein CERSUDRAFT_95518 [Gelatoporia subvermispora B]|uniref:Uncharacterized protein n=1 Tax=Ceriporiopsis subvermispora (strain B) TaxID=914234 RepID=M2RCM7_CERS8|nr:hypothetical protein CERSUDRAFT_95518 [Gelatoporia subvermispora B]